MPLTYVNIASQTLGSNQATVTFSSISQTYTDLALRISVRNSGAFDWGNITLRFNGDSSSLYSYTLLSGDGSAASSFRGTNQNNAGNTMNSATTTANTFSNIEYYIPSYTVAQNKPFYSSAVTENNATLSYVRQWAYLYRSTSAITSISLIAENNFVSGSTFYLYGIKNS